MSDDGRTEEYDCNVLLGVASFHGCQSSEDEDNEDDEDE